MDVEHVHKHGVVDDQVYRLQGHTVYLKRSLEYFCLGFLANTRFTLLMPVHVVLARGPLKCHIVAVVDVVLLEVDVLCRARADNCSREVG